MRILELSILVCSLWGTLNCPCDLIQGVAMFELMIGLFVLVFIFVF